MYVQFSGKPEPLDNKSYGRQNLFAEIVLIQKNDKSYGRQNLFAEIVLIQKIDPYILYQPKL